MRATPCSACSSGIPIRHSCIIAAARSWCSAASWSPASIRFSTRCCRRRRRRMSRQPGFTYIAGDGLDPVDAYDAARRAVEYCRTKRAPVFLHLRMIRMLGHAGSDVETEYHTPAEIEAVEKMDPLLRSAEIVVQTGLMSPDEVL